MQNLSSSRELESSLKVAYLYFSGMKQKDIANQLKITPSTVSRALARARQFVELKYNVPGDERLEAQLLLRYKLLDSVVVETSDIDQRTSIVGHAAARYFTLNVRDGDTVALSCGETLLEMVKAVPSLRAVALKLCQLSIEGDPQCAHQSPATLVGYLRSKLSKESSSAGIQLPPYGSVEADGAYRASLSTSTLIRQMRRETMQSRLVFIGVAPVESGQVLASSFKSLADPKLRQTLKTKIERLRVVGEINNRLFDARGKDVTDDIPEMRNIFIHVLNLSDLRELTSRGARVVLVAAGLRKLHAVRTALEAKIANVLIADREMANRLVA